MEDLNESASEWGFNITKSFWIWLWMEMLYILFGSTFGCWHWIRDGSALDLGRTYLFMILHFLIRPICC
jgi:hypothetical protein